MPAFSIVEDLDVLEYCRQGALTPFETFVVDQFRFDDANFCNFCMSRESGELRYILRVFPGWPNHRQHNPELSDQVNLFFGLSGDLRLLSRYVRYRYYF